MAVESRYRLSLNSAQTVLVPDSQRSGDEPVGGGSTFVRQFILLSEDNEIHMKHYKLQNHRLSRDFVQVHNYMYAAFVMRFINQLPLVRTPVATCIAKF